MTLTGIDAWLQRAYLISQICLVFVALGAAVAAYRQIRIFKLFELLKYLAHPDVTNGRRVVIYEISHMQGTEWWRDKHLEDSARNLATAYDHLGSFLESFWN